jgi:hypothetical protein
MRSEEGSMVEDDDGQRWEFTVGVEAAVAASIS